MKKYLVVLDFYTGIAQLNNVGIVEAKNEKEALEVASRALQINVMQPYKNSDILRVFNINSPDGEIKMWLNKSKYWFYFI